MAITFEAVYENGTLKLTQPLPLKEQERVRVTVETQGSPILEAYGIIGWKGNHETLERILTEEEDAGSAVERVRATAGLIGWTGDPEVFRQIAEDDAFGILESP